MPGLAVPWNFYAPTEDCKYDKTVNFIDLDPAAFPGIRNNGVPFLKLHQNFGTLEMNYDINPTLALTSVTGFYKAHADTMINGTFTGYAGPAISAAKSTHSNNMVFDVVAALHGIPTRNIIGM